MAKEIDQLLGALKGHDQLLIMPHNDPDPDAIAAAVGLQYLVTERTDIHTDICYQGIIGRAENKALVSYLNNPLNKLKNQDFNPDIPIALIDSQPGAGNNPLQTHILAAIVIDHHPWSKSAWDAKFKDVRPDFGASSTIIAEYLQTAELDVPQKLATALFYGIKTDTMGLGMKVTPKDVAMYIALQPRVDFQALAKIEQPQVPVTYFKSLTSAIQATRLYENNLAISYLGEIPYPDLGAEIADLLLRLQGVRWVICMGMHKRDFYLSVRSRSQKIGAGNLARHIVGDLGSAGGHGARAGGQIRLQGRDPLHLSDLLIEKSLLYLNIDPDSAVKVLI